MAIWPFRKRRHAFRELVTPELFKAARAAEQLGGHTERLCADRAEGRIRPSSFSFPEEKRPY